MHKKLVGARSPYLHMRLTARSALKYLNHQPRFVILLLVLVTLPPYLTWLTSKDEVEALMALLGSVLIVPAVFAVDALVCFTTPPTWVLTQSHIQMRRVRVPWSAVAGWEITPSSEFQGYHVLVVRSAGGAPERSLLLPPETDIAAVQATIHELSLGG